VASGNTLAIRRIARDCERPSVKLDNLRQIGYGSEPGARSPYDRAVATMKIARRPRLTVMLLLGMGLVFDGVEGEGLFQPRDNLVLGERGTRASRRLGPCLRHS